MPVELTGNITEQLIIAFRNMNRLEVFKSNGVIVCVKMGWIAVDIPVEWQITEAECRGTSTFYQEHQPLSYYDIALNGRVVLHMFRQLLGTSLNGEFKPYIFYGTPL